jgi:ferredoxin
MAKLIFVNNGQEIEVEDGSEISEACESAGVPFACGSEGICGSCMVEVVEGMENLSSPTEAEKAFIGEDDPDNRLACQCKILRKTVKLRF